MHSDERRQARRSRAAPALGPRPLVLDRRPRRAGIVYVTPGYQLVALDAKTGAPVAGFGKNGIVDLKTEDDQEMDLDHRRDRPARGADHREGRHRRRRRAPAGRRAEEQDQREGLRPRLRRADRQAALDLPHDSAAGEFGNDTWEKDSWSYTGNAGVWAQMSVDEELGLRLPAGRAADRRLLRRPSSRRRPVRREPRRARPEDRQAQVALPARAPRHLGHGHPVRADPRGHHRQRPADQGGRAADQAGLAVRVRSRRPASRSGRSKSGRSKRAPCRASGIRRRSRSSPSRRRSSARASSIDDLIDFTPELRAEAVKLVVALQDRPDLHAAGRQQVARAARRR